MSEKVNQFNIIVIKTEILRKKKPMEMRTGYRFQEKGTIHNREDLFLHLKTQ